MAAGRGVTSARVAAELRSRIERGELLPEDRLPSERELSESLHTTRVTSREALKQLEAEGLIYRSNRRGWFVTSQRINYNPSRAAFFMDYVADQGLVPFSRQLLKKRIVADDRLASMLEVSVKAPLVELQRLRGANGRPAYIETIYLPEGRLPGIYECDLERSVSAVMLGDYDQQYAVVELDITVGALSAGQAALLDAPPGYTCLCVRRVVRNAAGEVVEYDLEHWRHDSLNIQVRLDNS
ncbi:hypothetical protein GCM10011348_23390 [Marinobacterium nitratireducens]|uniref:HTH gntR-type domain-containing protein n=1 Tax=Marinobacterium nitratireducens TaxID=518897 RepID=A0A917ZI89_9GAMM|nr:UTRA domain-containing protein [Marinobacterium nitratireducens]GGO82307.1 hypothetical protein GCM10011348_23390 [Marinobacterium nitratireducens]